MRWVRLILLGTALIASASQAKPRTVGAQLYTVRSQLAADFEGTLTALASIGYRDVEFAELFGRDPVAVRKLLHRLGLRATSSHVDSQRLRSDPGAVIAQTRALGARYMVLAWIPPAERATLEQWREWTALLNRAGKAAHAQGVTLAYHAHDFEYRAIDGVRPIDLLMAGLDPRYVQFEMDIYWTVLGGGDPVAMLKTYPGRFPLAHAKDMSRSDTSMVDVGAGRIDFKTIFARADKRDFRYIYVEHDNAPDPLASLGASFMSLTRSIKK